ncbi:helix-turn-helix domain-containing protein [Acidisphaera sp. S103]|uniref:helix-turn-helix domain-containing protein n=1 Tax=Acidisphaera sp. S103 TaxID=1747223 RepID=UPI00131A7C59|nr:helix-turn-helix domain-containing protein [Acidisphaera sp. S103]
MEANAFTEAPDGPSAAGSTANFPLPSARSALGGTPWLDRVPAATLDRLADLAVLHRVPSGSTLFEQAEIPSFAQLLVSGSVALLGVSGTAETLIELVRPIDLLLPAAVLNRQPFLARARVLEEAHLVLIQAEVFRDALATDHALCLAVLGCLATQFRRQIKLAKTLKLRSAEERVGCYLLGLVQEAAPGVPVRLPMEKRFIAWQLGMARETFSRVLTGMERYGLHISGDVVEVPDAPPLRARFRLDPQIDGPEPILPFSPRRY